MVMADRPDVRTASAPIAAVDTLGLAQQFANAMVRVPFRRPWDGPAGLAHNLGQTVTREMVRTFMGYSSSLPIEEFRSSCLEISPRPGSEEDPFFGQPRPA